MKRWLATVNVRGPKYWLGPVEITVLSSSVEMAVKRAVMKTRWPRGMHVREVKVSVVYVAPVKKIKTAEEALAVVEESLERQREGAS